MQQRDVLSALDQTNNAPRDVLAALDQPQSERFVSEYVDTRLGGPDQLTPQPRLQPNPDRVQAWQRFLHNETQAHQYERLSDPDYPRQLQAVSELLALSSEPPRMSRPEAFSAGTTDVFTLGSADELAGFVAGPQAREAVRARMDQAQADRPVTNAAGGVLGGAGVAAATALSGGQNVTGSLAASAPLRTAAAVGAAEGGLYGFNSAEGNFVERLPGAAQGALFGGAMGPAVVKALGLASAAGRGVGQRLGILPNDQTADRLTRRAAEAADRSGVAEEIAQAPDALAGDDGSFLAERLGPNARSTSLGLAGAGGQAQEIAETAIEARMAGRPQRIADAMSAATDGNDALASLEMIDAARQSAKPLFNQADETIAPMSGNLVELIRRAERAGVSFADADRVAARNGESRVRLSTYAEDFGGLPTEARLGDLRALARAVEGEATRLVRNGENPGSLFNTARELRDVISAASPEYREAARIWRSSARDEAAFELGVQAFQPGARQTQTLRQFVTGGTTQSERRAFFAGVSDAMERRMASAPSSGNPGSRLDRRLIRQRLSLALGDDAADELISTIETEGRRARFESLANREVNSATAARLEGAERVARARSGGATRLFAHF